MILAVDVFYKASKANVVGILFEDWTQSDPTQTLSILIEGVADYEPGSFYKRELPCILELLKLISLETLDCIVVDSYVFLDKWGKKGLGWYLYEALEQKIPIIGVAKSYFHETDALLVCRGNSQKPLYITAIGTDVEEAAQAVRSMAGDFRFPTLLKYLDQQTKMPDLL